MPFDEGAHDSGGSGDGHRRPTEGYVNGTLQAIVSTGRRAGYCVACCLWDVGVKLVATHIALTLLALEKKTGKPLSDETEGSIVAEAMQEICDAFSEQYARLRQERDEEKRNG